LAKIFYDEIDWNGWTKKKDNAEKRQRRRVDFNTEITEGPQRTQRGLRNGNLLALDRKSPPFIPQKARDGAEFAKSAKDGAPSSSVDLRPNN
jgi:hypothetical protein